MVTASSIHRLSHAVDVIENQSQQGRPLKVVQVSRGYHQDPDAALHCHYAAHPEDRGADVVIFRFHDDVGAADDDCGAPTGPACGTS